MSGFFGLITGIAIGYCFQLNKKLKDLSGKVDLIMSSANIDNDIWR